jgi:hypothetical protein
MATSNSKKMPLEELLIFIDQLSPAELYALRRKLDNKIWGDQLETLFSTIDDRNKGLPPLSEEEIVAVIKEIRQEPKVSPVSETALLSEQTLAKDWMKPEEDKAWSDLSNQR